MELDLSSIDIELAPVGVIVECEDDSVADDVFAGLEDAVKEKSTRRQCQKCKSVYPLHASIFRPDREHPSGLSPKCVSCEIEEQKEVMSNVIAEASLRIDHGIQQRAIVASDNANGGDEAVPHLKNVFQQLMQVFGGSEGLAAATGITFIQGSPQIKQRLIDTVVRTGIKVTETGHADVPIESMTAIELEEMKRKIEGRLTEQARRIVESEAREGELVAAAG